MPANEKIYAALAKSLHDTIIKTFEPLAEHAVEILTSIQKESTNKNRPMTVTILESTKIGKSLARTLKVCKRQRNWLVEAAASDEEDVANRNDWDRAINVGEALLLSFKEVAEADRAKEANNAAVNQNSASTLEKNAVKALNNDNREEISPTRDLRTGRPKRKLRSMERFSSKSYDDAKKKARDDIIRNGSGKKRSREKIQVDKDKEGDGKKKSKKQKKPGKVGKTIDTNGDGSGSSRNNTGVQMTNDVSGATDTTTAENEASCNASDSTKVAPDEKTPSISAYEMVTNAIDSLNESIGIKQNDKSTEDTDDNMRCQPISEAEDKPIVISEETLPPATYTPHQRVHAKDDATGLLYPAMVRKVMWGPKSNQVSMGFTSSLVDGEPCGGVVEKEMEEAAAATLAAKNEEDEDEDSQRWDPKHNCYHYYVHYMGWAVRWDRWVEGMFIYDNSEATVALAKILMKEYKMFKPKKGQKMSIAQVNKWMVRMREIETEHKEGLINGNQGDGGGGGIGEEGADLKISAENDNTDGNEDSVSGETMKEHFQQIFKAGTPVEEETAQKKGNDNDAKAEFAARKLVRETLQKQSQLRQDGLQMKRKRSVSDRLKIPFNLKKISVEEWEVITQCDMVHNVPCKVTVREALNQYLESKLAPLREKNEEESSSNDDKKPSADDGGENMHIEESVDTSNKTGELGKEWIGMVEVIARFFDQALSAHLLFEEERGQYNLLRRQILAQRRNSAANAVSSAALLKADKSSISEEASLQSGITNGSTTTEMDLVALPKALPKESKLPHGCRSPAAITDSGTTASESSVAKAPPINFLPERMSEIFGCEHLLRLFVRLPSIVAQSPQLEPLSRQIFSQLGDLVRYFQKHQSQLFCASFRKPLQGECRRGKKVNGKL